MTTLTQLLHIWRFVVARKMVDFARILHDFARFCACIALTPKPIDFAFCIARKIVLAQMGSAINSVPQKMRTLQDTCNPISLPLPDVPSLFPAPCTTPLCKDADALCGSRSPCLRVGAPPRRPRAESSRDDPEDGICCSTHHRGAILGCHNARRGCLSIVPTGWGTQGSAVGHRAILRSGP